MNHQFSPFSFPYLFPSSLKIKEEVYDENSPHISEMKILRQKRRKKGLSYPGRVFRRLMKNQRSKLRLN